MEEFVVAAITICVAASLSIDFFYEAAAIIALGGWSWFVERRAKRRILDSSFRPGASGIFLGAITWPLVLASRLSDIRGFLPDPASNGRILFWSAALCSAKLLYFFTKPFAARLEESSLLFFSKRAAAFFALSILLKYATGYNQSIWIALLAIQFFGSTIFLQHLLQNFPRCGTPGEMLLVASGIAIYGGHMLLTCFGHARDPIDGMLQVGFLGLSLMPQTYKCFLWLTRNSKAPAFVASFAFIMVVVAPTWLRLTVGIHRHPVLWVMDFMLEKPFLRLGLCMYWISILCLVPFVYKLAKEDRYPQILVRKGYHLIAVIMFVPGALIEKEFLHLAFTVAFVVFGLAEMLRIWQIPLVGPKITEFMQLFADHRDSDKLVISHFSLLLGCALPVWLHHRFRAQPLARLAGVLSIGIADAAASLIGYKYGSWRISNTNKKTVEGTAAGILSLALSCIFIQKLFLKRSDFQIISVIFAGLLEAYTSQMDNIFVPLIFYALLAV